MIRERISAPLVAAYVALITGVLAACDDSGPAITGTPAKTAIVGQAYRFQPKAVNVNEGHRLSFTIANKPSWASFDSFTGQLSGTPSANEVGLFSGIQISLMAATGSGAVHASLPSFSITVVPASATASAANTVTLSWQAPTGNTDGSLLTNLSGYKIYYGGASGEYSNSIDVPDPGLTSYVVQNLATGRYFFTVTSYNSVGAESGFSPELSATLD